MDKSSFPGILKPTPRTVQQKSVIDYKDQLAKPKVKVSLARPAFIARKINTEELHGSGLKSANISSLSQITEKYDEQDLVSQTGDAKSHFYIDNKSSRNLFQTEMLSSSLYKEHSKGPVYKNDKLIKHSIIGPVEMFENYQKALNKFQNKGNATGEQENISDLSPSKVIKYMTPSMTNEESFASGAMTANSNNIRGSLICGRSTKKEKNIKVDKHELLDQINEMKKNQEKFYKTQAFEYSSLPIEEKLQKTKDERRLDKFNQTLDSWQKTTSKISQKVGRTPERSVMSRGEIHREKKEMTDFLETVKPVDEKLGDYYWYLTLRKYGEDCDKSHFAMTKDLPDGFRTKQLNRSFNPYQVIRKPGEMFGMMTTTSYFNEPKQIDRSSREYLHNKLFKFEKLVKKMNGPGTTQLEGLMVQGKNKLDMEATAILGKDEKRDTFYMPKDLKKNKEIVDEMIEKSYEQRPSKRGHSVAL